MPIKKSSGVGQRIAFFGMTALLFLLFTTACSATAPANANPTIADQTDEEEHESHQESDSLPDLKEATIGPDERLEIVASTNIVADVVRAIGGDNIDLVALMPTGVDPHGYEPTPQDLIALTDAHAVFINGLGLETSLMAVLETAEGDGVVIAVNTGVPLLDLVHDEEHADEEHADEEHADEEHAEHEHEEVDPHTWFSIQAVDHWVDNIKQVLSELDPDNASAYADNAAQYRSALSGLEDELDDIVAELSPERRKLITDHDSFGYFADAYDFEVIGTVMPSLSTTSAPSASQLARLHDQIVAEGVEAIFVGTTVNPDVATAIATDTGVRVVPLYTGSLSEAGGPADNYLDFMRYNVTAIVDALNKQ